MKSSISFGVVFLLAGSRLSAGEQRNLRQPDEERLHRNLVHHGGNHPPPGHPPPGHPPPPGGYGHPPPGYHDPYKKPTDRPTPYPTPNPTPIPTPYPTRRPTTPAPTRTPSYEPSAEPSPEPSIMPSMVPSIEPTESQEPSEDPTESSEPSENPTESYEPSENPTESEEPSEMPTESEEPTSDDFLTLAEFICADENENLFGSLCILITISPAVFALLNGDVFIDLTEFQGVPNFDADEFQAQFRFIHQPIVPDLAKKDLGGMRNLQERKKLTMFAPTNSALNRFLLRSINEFFDPDDPEVIEFFDEIGIDVSDDHMRVNDFLFTINGRVILTQILLTHIINGEVDSKTLRCNRSQEMLSGEDTTTECFRKNQNTRYKFQVGDGNTEQDRPRVFGTDTPASNGILHVIDAVILPNMTIPEEIYPPTNVPGIIIGNQLLQTGILQTQDPTETPIN